MTECSDPPSKRFKLENPDIVSGLATFKRDVAEEEGMMGSSLLDKVPPEMWEMIFGYLDTPTDQQSVMNACGKWHTLMAPQRTLILFPLVLPHISKYLPISSILRFRQVCKHWQDSVDMALQNHATSLEGLEEGWLFTRSTSLQHVSKNLRYGWGYSFTTVKELNAFQGRFSSDKNPFINRTIEMVLDDVYVEDDDDEEDEEGIFNGEHVIPFLKKFGEHVWNLKYTSEIEDNILGNISRTLQHLPNLRYLRIAFENLDDDLLEDPREAPFSLLPPLPGLIRLNIEMHPELEAVLGSRLFQQYGHQLKSLTCSGITLEQFSPQIVQECLPNLRNLSFFTISKKTLRRLSKLNGLPLEYLQMSGSHLTEDLEFKHVVKAINPFSTTLVELHISLVIAYPVDRFLVKRKFYDKLRIPFPKLKRLSVSWNRNRTAWLMQMVKLKFRGLETLDIRILNISGPELNESISSLSKTFNEFFEYCPNLRKILFYNENCQQIIVIPRGGMPKVVLK